MMTHDIRIHIGQGQRGEATLQARYANRHGLIAGCTGSGKTVTLETLALGFSMIGVPVFLADVKGDISIALQHSTAPLQMLDPFGSPNNGGKKFSISVSRMGPELLARTLGLSDVQAGVLDVLFAAISDSRQTFSTLGDFRLALNGIAYRGACVPQKYGHVSATSAAVIQRALLRVEREGGATLFRAPTFDVADLLHDCRGQISVLQADRLMRSPQLYAAALLFILQELYDRLPEVGDLDRPRLVLFLDEAHLLFQDCPPALLSRIERIVRLIRSKGVGLFFATQSPADIPSIILGQLGNRIQHGLRAATPADQRAVRAAADTLPVSPGIAAAAEIGRLGVGQALVSTVGQGGVPQPVDIVRVREPELLAEAPARPVGAAVPPCEVVVPQRAGFFSRLFSGEM